MNSKAGPSSTKTKIKVRGVEKPGSSRPALSKETIESDLDHDESGKHEGDDSIEDDVDESESADSEGDIEAVTPRRKTNGIGQTTSAPVNKRSLP